MMVLKKHSKKPFVTRFAPSPTGYLHKGHAYAALTAYQRAQSEGGVFLLRIEDIDQTRCRPEYIDAIYQDLAWLGLKWQEPVRVQSQHYTDYRQALQRLDDQGLVYPCFCTRKDIQRELAASPSAPHGPHGPTYPGTCKQLSDHDVKARIDANAPYAFRLNLDAALSHIDAPLSWFDEVHGLMTAAPEILGDVILARKDTPTSYHLSVVVDDALQNISHIIRGNDLLDSTHIHVVLQQLLGLPTPVYHHHELLHDEAGERLAKRTGARSIKDDRKAGVLVNQYYTELGFSAV